MPFSECFPPRAPGVGGGEGVSSLSSSIHGEGAVYSQLCAAVLTYLSALPLSCKDCIPVTEMPRIDLPNRVSGAQALGCESQTRPQALPSP